jgi:ribosomal protein S18 acetylase RimI-like enzyme
MAVQGRLTFLVDSNVFMTLEPLGHPGATEPYELAARLVRLTHDHGHLLAVSSATREDIYRDPDDVRREHSLSALRKYVVLEGIPASDRIRDAFGDSPNDQVDAAIASALDARAAHVLVTEDVRLRKRISSAAPELAERVRSLAEAVEFLDLLHPAARQPPPLVERVVCYQLDLDDPIFDSIREDYAPDFDAWFHEKCQLGRRDAFVVSGESGRLAGLCILKDENDGEYGLPSPRLKMCTLKVAEAARGQRLGELLVKAALDDAITRKRVAASVTAFPRHHDLLVLLGDLGFTALASRTPLGELVLVRPVVAPPDIAAYEAFELNRRFGPRVVNVAVPIHVVPIKPKWEQRLFPEGRLQMDLLSQYVACGNGLRKAYLSNSLNRTVSRGDLVLFYRSEDVQEIRFVGVVEDTLATSDYLEIAQFVGTRTVYSEEEIQELTANGQKVVNAILFRQSPQLEPGWPLRDLVANGVFRRAPQSIQQVREDGAEWVRQRLSA